MWGCWRIVKECAARAAGGQEVPVWRRLASLLNESQGGAAMTTVNVRYMVHDVEAALAFYTSHLGFTVLSKTLPAFADVARGDLRLLLSGPTSSAGRAMPDGRQPGPGGWNRIHLIVAGPRRRGSATPRGRASLPQRHRDGAGRFANPPRRSFRQSGRASSSLGEFDHKARLGESVGSPSLRMGS